MRKKEKRKGKEEKKRKERRERGGKREEYARREKKRKEAHVCRTAMKRAMKLIYLTSLT